MSAQRAHLAIFARHDGIETLFGPDVIETYRPMCSTKSPVNEPILTFDWQHVTCKRCLAVIAKIKELV